MISGFRTISEAELGLARTIYICTWGDEIMRRVTMLTYASLNLMDGEWIRIDLGLVDSGNTYANMEKIFTSP